MSFSFLRTIVVLLVLGLLPVAQATGPKTVEMSVVTDWETVEFFGGPEQTQEYLQRVTEATAQIYREQLGVELVVSFTEIPVQPEHDTIASHTHANFLLQSVQEHRLNNVMHYTSDVTTLFSVRDLSLGSRKLLGFATTDEAGRRRARRVSSACGIKRLALHLVAMSIRKQAADGNLKH